MEKCVMATAREGGRRRRESFSYSLALAPVFFPPIGEDGGLPLACNLDNTPS